MKDKRIIELFFARDEVAISETEKKYTDLCHYIAGNFLTSREDREECINDSLLVLWNSIPPAEPESLSAYLGSIVRNRAINMSKSNNAWKRGGNVQIVNDECLNLISDGRSLAEDYESRRAGEVINAFIEGLNKSERKVFILRYWFDASTSQIARQTGFSESKIKSMLARLRARLAQKLQKEGIII